MPPPSPAREVFDAIRSAPDPFAHIATFVDEKRSEDDSLEFKQAPHLPLKDPKWSEIWGEVLCGFANAGGGVLVWGIKADRDPTTGVDAANEVKLVPNPTGVKARLNQFGKELTNPPLGDVAVEVYTAPDNPDAGFVVCYVPEGPFKPYCTRRDGKYYRYLIRMGDSFLPMPRHMLQTLFYPRIQAQFRVKMSLTWAATRVALGSPRQAEARMIATLVNDGTATAKDLYVLGQNVVPESLNKQAIYLPNRELFHRDQNQFEFLIDLKLHPNQSVIILQTGWAMTLAPTPYEGLLPSGPLPEYDLAIWCENQDRQLFRVRFPTELKSLVGEYHSEFQPVPAGT